MDASPTFAAPLATSSTPEPTGARSGGSAVADRISPAAHPPRPNTEPDGRTRRPGGLPTPRIALIGNPNTGKTTIFNRLCGVRAKTANFPGVTVEAKLGRLIIRPAETDDATRAGDNPDGPATTAAPAAPAAASEIIDLPGVYRLALEQPESIACRNVLSGEDTTVGGRPDATVVVLDASNLARNLPLVLEVQQYGLPVIVALNMIDIAQRRGLSIDTDRLGALLGCPVIATAARSGEGIATLRSRIARLARDLADDDGSTGFRAGLVAVDRSAQAPAPPIDLNDRVSVMQWADATFAACAGGGHSAIGSASDSITDRLDTAFTHPLLGLAIFAVAMAGLFSVLFWLASYPMDFIDASFAWAAEFTGSVLPEGPVRDLVADGIVGGVGGVLVFLPQICLLFFLLSLLEDTGYLARAAFVMDRLMCRFGLPGHAFVPLLSSHACAIPGIMSAKLIPDRKDRIATILIAPFMSCSARIPVYALLTGLLFGDRPMLAGLAFFGCYVLGAVLGMVSAFIARRTVLRGESRPMMLELPSYKMPSLRSALLAAWDRGLLFVKKAGTVILAIVVVLWWLSSYPKVDPPAAVEQLRAQVAALEAAPAVDAAAIEALTAEADAIEAEHAMANSYAGRIGRFAEPAFAPIGAEWRLSVAILSSFAAREVFVSTLGVLVAGTEDIEIEGIREAILDAERVDGTPLLTIPAAAALLVFFVSAMQCLPTLPVTRRETGSWKWAGLQLAYMTVVAYTLAFITFQGLTLLGLGSSDGGAAPAAAATAAPGAVVTEALLSGATTIGQAVALLIAGGAW